MARVRVRRGRVCSRRSDSRRDIRTRRRWWRRGRSNRGRGRTGRRGRHGARRQRRRCPRGRARARRRRRRRGSLRRAAGSKTPPGRRQLERDPGDLGDRDAVGWAWVRVEHGGAGGAAALAGRDLAWDVHLADVHVREVVERARAGSGDGHGSAVHVELVAVTGDSDPSPDERMLVE